jgi:hypothetical protein
MAVMMAITIPVAGMAVITITIPTPGMVFATITIAIPMPGMLSPAAIITTFVLPRISFCRSKRCREQQSQRGHAENLHRFHAFRSGTCHFETDEAPEQSPRAVMFRRRREIRRIAGVSIIGATDRGDERAGGCRSLTAQ